MTNSPTNSYEDAPATRMLATQCACCSRPLVDAVSVEVGVGPDCRVKHGYGEAQAAPDWDWAERELAPGDLAIDRTKSPREAANLLVYWVAARQDGPDVLRLVSAIRALGFVSLADRIARRLARVSIALEAGHYVVRGPYSDEAVAAFRSIPGRRFDRESKSNIVPASSRRELFAALKRAYPGETASGPRGLFQIEAA